MTLKNENNEVLINSIVDIIEKGQLPHEHVNKWIKNPLCQPHNFITGAKIKGINALRLQFIDKNPTKQFATFKQIKNYGGSIKKGSGGIYLDWVYPLDEEEINKRNIRLDKWQKDTLKEKGFAYFYSSVYYFNLAQTNIDPQELKNWQKSKNFPKELYEDFKDSPIKNFKNNEEIEEILKNSKIKIINNINSSMAFYQPSSDEITLPNKEYFLNEDYYYSTALHELGHATGAEHRLDRKLSTIGTKGYAKEELVAELFSTIKSIELGIETKLHDRAYYLNNWNKAIKGSNLKEELTIALKEAEKASKYVEQWYPQSIKEKQNFKIREETIKPKLQEVKKTKRGRGR